MPERLMYPPAEAGEKLGVGRSTVYELIASGELESVKVGRCRRIPADALEAFVARIRAEQSVPAA